MSHYTSLRRQDHKAQESRLFTLSKYLNFMNSKDGVRQIFTREKIGNMSSKEFEQNEMFHVKSRYKNVILRVKLHSGYG